MVYKMSLSSNPKILLLFVFIIAAIGFGIAAFFLSGFLLGIIILGIALYLDYQIILFVRRQFASFIETDDTGLKFNLFKEEESKLNWNTITCAGISEDESGPRKTIFVYVKETDTLLTIPSEINDFDKLIGELKERVEFFMISISKGENLKEKLKSKIL